MITTPDGTVDVNGRSGPLGGPADQQRLRSLRETASVVLVGAGTVRAESYRAPSRSDLRIAVVTQSCNLDFSSGLFTSGAGLIVTTTTAQRYQTKYGSFLRPRQSLWRALGEDQ